MMIKALFFQVYTRYCPGVLALHPREWSAKQRKFLICEAIACVVAAPVVYFGVAHLQERYWVGVDPSELSCLPWRIAVVEKVSPTTENMSIDTDLPVVVPSKGMAPYVPDGLSIGKLIVGRPGDVVRINESGVSVTSAKDGATRVIGYIDDNAIRRADDKRGIPAGLSRRSSEMFYRTFAVGEGEVFLMGVQPTSQDGRYFGTRKFADVKGVVRYVI